MNECEVGIVPGPYDFRLFLDDGVVPGTFNFSLFLDNRIVPGTFDFCLFIDDEKGNIIDWDRKIVGSINYAKKRFTFDGMLVDEVEQLLKNCPGSNAVITMNNWYNGIVPGTFRFGLYHDDGEGNIIDWNGKIVGWINYTTKEFSIKRILAYQLGIEK